MTTDTREALAALPELPKKRRAMFCTKCGFSGPTEAEASPQGAPCQRCSYTAFVQEVDYSDDEMRDYARAALTYRQQGVVGQAGLLQDAVALLLEARDFGQFSDAMFDHPSASCRSPAQVLRVALRTVLDSAEFAALAFAPPAQPHVVFEHDTDEAGTLRVVLTPPAQPQSEPPPLLVRDLAEILGATVPVVCAALVAMGKPPRSTNMAVGGEEAVAVAKHLAASQPPKQAVQ